MENLSYSLCHSAFQISKYIFFVFFFFKGSFCLGVGVQPSSQDTHTSHWNTWVQYLLWLLAPASYKYRPWAAIVMVQLIESLLPTQDTQVRCPASASVRGTCNKYLGNKPEDASCVSASQVKKKKLFGAKKWESMHNFFMLGVCHIVFEDFTYKECVRTQRDSKRLIGQDVAVFWQV